MQVRTEQIRQGLVCRYRLWDGEMTVTVFQQYGVYGHCSAAIVVDRIDDPIEVFTWNGYKGSSIPSKSTEVKPTPSDMRSWIASKLTELSTGTDKALGISSDVDGLLKV